MTLKGEKNHALTFIHKFKNLLNLKNLKFILENDFKRFEKLLEYNFYCYNI